MTWADDQNMSIAEPQKENVCTSGKLIPPKIFARLGSRRYRIDIRARSKLGLREFPGVTLRGGFGFALRDLVCTESKNQCEDCAQKFGCSYSYLFETPVPDEMHAHRKFDKAPHPFVMNLGPEWKAAADTRNLPIDLLLIGNGVSHLPTCLLALSHLGRKGFGIEKTRFSVENAFDLDYGNELFGPNNKVTLRAPLPFEPDTIRSAKEVAVSFITPVQFRIGGKPAGKIPFHLLIRNLLRRLSLLSLFHAGTDPDLDYRGIIKEAETIRMADSLLEFGTVERVSSRQRKRISLGSLSGIITYTGNLSKYLPLLAFGERFHVGRGTSLGMGMMRVKVVR